MEAEVVVVVRMQKRIAWRSNEVFQWKSMDSPLHPTNRIHCATCVPYSSEERWLSVSAIFLHKKIELVYPYIDEDKDTRI